jgi:hypothetical protein
VTPYLKEEQSTSGTLAYAVGCGKAVISTPYRYARELLGDGRGILVPSRDSAAIAREVVALLDDPSQCAQYQQRAAAFGKTMSWPSVARRYVESFEQARVAHARRQATGTVRADRTAAKRRSELPEIDLAHVRLMTDDTGILQHATFDVPRYSDGYCLDDNARALLLMTHLEEAGTEAPAVLRALATRYLAFVNHAFDETSGRFHNFLTYARHWHDEPGSDDSHGRALWALGAVIARSSDPGRRGLSARLFRGALPLTLRLTSPRAWSYTLLGIDEYLRAFEGDSSAAAIRADLTGRLMGSFRASETADWLWFEDRLTYSNARLPQALLVSGARMGDREMVETARRALDWLMQQHVAKDGTFAPVGSNGFHVRGGPRASFDQQPVEACSMVSACLDAYRLTGQSRFLDHARLAFHWFLGHNSRNAQVYDARNGGCRDGIHADRFNENQGAESTLSFLTALAEMRAADRLASRLVLGADAATSAGRTTERASTLEA